METKYRNSRRRDVCSIDVHRASLEKHLKTEKHLEIRRVVPTNFFIQSNESNIIKKNNLKPFRETAGEKLKKLTIN